MPLVCRSLPLRSAPKEGKEDKEPSEAGDRPGSVMSSLSYRKRGNLKDSIGGQGDEETLFSTLSERPASPDRAFRRAKRHSVASASDVSWKKPQGDEEPDDRGSVISQAFSEASSRARKGLEKRWSVTTPDFDKASAVSAPVSRTPSFRRGPEADEDDARSSLSFALSSPGSLRRSMSRLDEPLAGVSGALSPALSRRSELGLEPAHAGSRADSRLSLGRSRLDEWDEVSSVAPSESRSLYSQPSLGRSFSVPPRPRTAASDELPLGDADIRPVGHRTYLDPDLEAAINEVLSYKPIKFKRSSLDPDSDEDDAKSVRSSRSAAQAEGMERATGSLRRSASALDFSRPRSSRSRRSSTSSSSSEDTSSSSERKKKSSKKHGKKAKKKGKKKQPSSGSGSSSDTSSGSTVSYRSSSSVKKGPKKKDPDSGGEGTEKSSKQRKKEEKQRRKQVDSLMMKYLYRPESD